MKIDVTNCREAMLVSMTLEQWSGKRQRDRSGIDIPQARQAAVSMFSRNCGGFGKSHDLGRAIVRPPDVPIATVF